MSEELPDWLAEMRDQQLGEELRETPIEEPAPREQVAGDILENLDGPAEQVGELDQTGQEGVWKGVEAEAEQEDVETEASESDVLEGLREQMAQIDDEFEYDDRHPLVRTFADLDAWQRFLLALLLFLNVGVCGCLALVMTGRIWPSW